MKSSINVTPKTILGKLIVQLDEQKEPWARYAEINTARKVKVVSNTIGSRSTVVVQGPHLSESHAKVEAHRHTVFSFRRWLLEELYTPYKKKTILSKTEDACYDRGITFGLKLFLNDEAPSPKIVGNWLFFFV